MPWKITLLNLMNSIRSACRPSVNNIKAQLREMPSEQEVVEAIDFTNMPDKSDVETLFGRLENGDRLSDFSKVGSLAFQVPANLFTIDMYPLPESDDLDVDRSLEIQNALQTLQSMPLIDGSGLRGQLRFHPGQYRIDCQGFDITESGIVISGSLDDRGDPLSRLICYCKDSGTLFRIQGKQPAGQINKPANRFAAQFHPQDATRRVPVNSKCLYVPLKSPSGRQLSIGDSVRVVRCGNQQWITKIGMDQVPPRPDNGERNAWQAPFDIVYDRNVIDISQCDQDSATVMVTLDHGVPSPIEERYGGGYIYQFDASHLLSHIVIQNLTLECSVDPVKQAKTKTISVCVCEDHLDRAVTIDCAQHCIISNVTSTGFGNHSWVKNTARYVSIRDCKYLEPAAKVEGAKRYGWLVSGQMVLVSHCFASKARHALITDNKTAGPVVFHKCISVEDLTTSETHQKWATGVLFDNCRAQISVQNRLWMGTAHGWSGAFCVCWNCEGSITVQSPPCAWNYVIGQRGQSIVGKVHFPQFGNGQQCFLWEDTWGNRTEIPSSLFLYQSKFR